jgi:hypothetical protein
MANLLGLTESAAEESLNSMVVAKSVEAKIDRLDGIVDFTRSMDPNEVNFECFIIEISSINVWVFLAIDTCSITLYYLPLIGARAGKAALKALLTHDSNIKTSNPNLKPELLKPSQCNR